MITALVALIGARSPRALLIKDSGAEGEARAQGRGGSGSGGRQSGTGVTARQTAVARCAMRT
ncbi:hypothetical protein ACFWAX_40985, partial [Streptomyces sp. NPDC059956]